MVTGFFRVPIKIKCIENVDVYFSKDFIYEKLNDELDSIIVYDDFGQAHILVDDDDWEFFDKYFEIIYGGEY